MYHCKTKLKCDDYGNKKSDFLVYQLQNLLWFRKLHVRCLFYAKHNTNTITNVFANKMLAKHGNTKISRNTNCGKSKQKRFAFIHNMKNKPFVFVVMIFIVLHIFNINNKHMFRLVVLLFIFYLVYFTIFQLYGSYYISIAGSNLFTCCFFCYVCILLPPGFSSCFSTGVSPRIENVFPVILSHLCYCVVFNFVLFFPESHLGA